MMKIANRKIGNGHPVFIVAEISANHGQSLNRAVSLIKKAKECGADAVKFQAYTPDTLTLDVNNKYFKIKHPKWGSRTLYSLYKEAFTPWDWFKTLKRAADDSGLIFFSTAFDKTSVDFLESLKVQVHKIASFELADLPLIEYVSGTKKPLILSTGMSTLKEIKGAFDAAKASGAKELILLKCTSSYPAEPKEMNLKTIPHMAGFFKCPVGLSDHSLGAGVSVAAVSLGANMIEKHFTISRGVKTPDSFFSMEPREFKQMVENIRIAELSLGRVCYKLTGQEAKSRIFRRSLFAAEDINKGEIFTERNMRSVRPSAGIEPKYLNKILGRKASRRIKKGTPIKWHLVDR